jgi:hypothetical protein
MKLSKDVNTGSQAVISNWYDHSLSNLSFAVLSELPPDFHQETWKYWQSMKPEQVASEIREI